MKGYYEATRKKTQTVGEFLKKASERNYASAQIDQHNMKEGTTKLKMVKDTIHYKDGSGWTALNMLHDPIMEINALEAIRMVNPKSSHSIYPTLAQIYEVRRADERAILQNHENLNREVFLTQDLKTKLLKYKKESVDMYETDSHWPSDENYDTVLDKEHTEIQWLQMFGGTQNDFFNSEYVKGFGLVFQYNPPANQGQNQPLPLPQAPNHNPEPNPDEEDAEMLKELRAQLEQMMNQMNTITTEMNTITTERDTANQRADQLIIERDEVIEQRDIAFEQVADRDRIIEEREQTITELTEQNTELTNTVTERDGTIDDLNTTIEGLNTRVQDLENTVADRDTQIDNLNNNIHDLQETHVDQTPQINDLTHRLEIVSVQKEGLETRLADRNIEIKRLTENIDDLRQSVSDSRQEKLELRRALNDEKTSLKQINDLLEGRIDNLSVKVEGKNNFIHQIHGYFEEYETLMSGCNNCNQYNQHHIDWQLD